MWEAIAKVGRGHLNAKCVLLSYSDMSLSCYMPGLLVTASADDTIKFWDIHVSV